MGTGICGALILAYLLTAATTPGLAFDLCHLGTHLLDRLLAFLLGLPDRALGLTALRAGRFLGGGVLRLAVGVEGAFEVLAALGELLELRLLSTSLRAFGDLRLTATDAFLGAQRSTFDP